MTLNFKTSSHKSVVYLKLYFQTFNAPTLNNSLFVFYNLMVDTQPNIYINMKKFNNGNNLYHIKVYR